MDFCRQNHFVSFQVEHQMLEDLGFQQEEDELLKAIAFPYG